MKLAFLLRFCLSSCLPFALVFQAVKSVSGCFGKNDFCERQEVIHRSFVSSSNGSGHTEKACVSKLEKVACRRRRLKTVLSSSQFLGARQSGLEKVTADAYQA